MKNEKLTISDLMSANLVYFTKAFKVKARKMGIHFQTHVIKYKQTGDTPTDVN